MSSQRTIIEAQPRMSVLPWVIIVILLLAAGTRLANVDGWPVWTDEGWSIRATDEARVEVVLNQLAYDRHPPLYFLALSGWRSLSGESRLALRFLSIAGGILTVAVAYRLGADVFGRRAGLYGALLLSVLPIAVYYSQEVRHYGWFVLLSALSWLLYLRYLKYPKFGILLGYCVTVALSFYTLYFAVLPLAVQVVVGVVWMARARTLPYRQRWGLLGAWAAAGVLYLPWLWVIATIQLPTLTTGIANLPGTYAVTLANLLPLSELLLGGQVVVPLALGAAGLWAVWQGGGLRRWAVVAGGVGLFVVMFGLSLRFELLSGRTLVFLTPLLVLPVGYGLALLGGMKGRLPMAGLLAGVYVLVTLAAPAMIQPRIDSDVAARTVAAQYAAGDVIVLETGWDDNAFAYELRRVIPTATIIRTISRADIYSDEKDLLPALLPVFETQRRVWVVQWLQAAQIMPFFENGGLGFREVLRYEQPVNADYRARFGDSSVQIVLYERPELDGVSWRFGDQFWLRDVVVAEAAQAGEALHVDLWWTALEAPALDYSVGVFLLDAAGAVRAEQNGPPRDRPTTQWTVDELVFDRHRLMLPDDLAAGRYRLVVNLYWYGDNQPLPVEGEPFATITEIEVR
ncbi:MAG: glycosyltransferase family 39 protein [Anaerolineae bacterium]|nr:glycosyltransferase family 39 protein [Anaerolineae bacterium]